MSNNPKPEAVQRIEDAEQKIVHSVEVASTVTEELSKFGDANFDAVSRLAEDFLDNIKDAQAILQDVIRNLPPATAFQGRSYIQRLQADAAAAAAAAAEALAAAEGQPSGAQPPAQGAAHPGGDMAQPMDAVATSHAGGAAVQ